VLFRSYVPVIKQPPYNIIPKEEIKIEQLINKEIIEIEKIDFNSRNLLLNNRNINNIKTINSAGYKIQKASTRVKTRNEYTKPKLKANNLYISKLSLLGILIEF
jgi:hypothetical protein